jgi:3-methyl-2-oxobutanoate hydroxymethyltransferase
MFTMQDFLSRKKDGRKISMLTAYDDSLGMVVQGLDNTLPVTMDEMIYHTKMVSRAVKNAMVIGDMPFMSYQAGVNDALMNAGRFLKEAGAAAVKMEGGAEVLEHIRAMTKSDIPVMAHIGLTPQSIHRMGGYKVQGRTEKAAKKLIEDARGIEDAGAFSLLLEAIPMNLAKKITETLSIPTIGIGAGPHCDGQVLVLHDVIGMFERFVPRFVKRYGQLKKEALKAVSKYKDDVDKGKFPSKEQSFT